ncbi:MAG: carboxylesterase/lipase family protein [Sulfurifustaceae bacterium]
MKPNFLSNFPRLLAVLATAILAVVSVAAFGKDVKNSAHTVVLTDDGPVKAFDRPGMRSYFAIPYATPPVGDLRWMPPTPPAKWRQPLTNTHSNPPCLQTSNSPFKLANGQEDCLYVDVHAPADKDGPFPVMVWFHGGAFNTGGTVTYSNPSPLVTKGAIVVTVAYRMGPMGFLGHPVLEASGTGPAPAGTVGNYGIMDQQAALRWVQNNIGAFGGDPDNVTIFGESAGGFSVMTHLASPLSADLFAKAIVESGGYAFDRQLPKATLESQSTTIVNNAINAAVAAGEPNPCPSGVTADCLRNASVSFIQNRLAPAFNAIQSSPVPSIDGWVLPQSIKATFQAGLNNKVPIMNGSNENEWTLFLAIPELNKRVAANNFDLANLSFLSTSTGATMTTAIYPAVLAGQAAASGLSPTQLAAAYPLSAFGNPSSPLSASLGAAAEGTDWIFACPALNLSKRAATQGTPIYMYEFRDQTAIPSIGIDANGNPLVTIPQGAAHSYEIQYLFQLRDLKNQERADLQQAMSGYWTNFAHTGNPSNGPSPVPATWPAFAGNGGSDVLGLDVASGGGVAPLSTSFDTAHKCSSVFPMLTF